MSHVPTAGLLQAAAGRLQHIIAAIGHASGNENI